MHRTTFATIAACLLGWAGLTLTPLAHAQALPEPAGLTTTASGLQYVVSTHGSGASLTAGQVVISHYRGTLMDGTQFDSSVARGQPFAFTLGRKQVIKGMDEAFEHLRVGDKATLIIPPQLAYGDKQRGAIPPNSTLRFDVEVLDAKPMGLADVLGDVIDAQGLDAARQRFAAMRAVQFGQAYVAESQLNALGYRYMGKDKLPEALAVLQWGVELFPNSGNLHDSLGEAQLKAGQREAAQRSYEKSLALDPANANAKKVLADMQAAAAPK